MLMILSISMRSPPNWRKYDKLWEQKFMNKITIELHNQMFQIKCMTKNTTLSAKIDKLQKLKNY